MAQRVGRGRGGALAMVVKLRLLCALWTLLAKCGRRRTPTVNRFS